jgi:hypothetical protein
MSALPAMPSFHEFGGALIASPDGALRQQVLHRLNGRCRPIQQVIGGADALAKLEKGDWQVLFLDRRLPDLDADELRVIIKRRFPGITVVLLDSDGEQSIKDDATTEEPPAIEPAKNHSHKVAEIVSVNSLCVQNGSARGSAHDHGACHRSYGNWKRTGSEGTACAESKSSKTFGRCELCSDSRDAAGI